MAATAQSTTNKTRERNGSASGSDTELATEVEALRDDINAITDRLGKIAGAGAKTARSHRDATARSLRDKTDELIEDLTHQVAVLERKAGVNVRRNPVRSMAIAAGAGFLVALLMRR